MSAGAALWLALAIALVVWTVATAAARRHLPTIVDVVHWLLASWAGRTVFLVLWAVAGWHVFTQRP
jgi:hypothetical protein